MSIDVKQNIPLPVYVTNWCVNRALQEPETVVTQHQILNA